MQIRIQPSTIAGTITPPASKSLMQRALAAALLTHGKTIINNPCYCDDVEAATGIICSMGATVKQDTNKIEINSKGLQPPGKINCGESGLSMRMFTPIASLLTPPVEFTARGSLLNRPVDNIQQGLTQLGVSCSNPGNGVLPLLMQGGITKNNANIDGSLGSQFLTGLLMALPCRNEDTILEVSQLKSIPYIDMTLELLDHFGIEINHDNYSTFHIPGNQSYNPNYYTVETDWSSAAPLLVAGALKGSVKLNLLNDKSHQADKAIITALKKCGARVVWQKETLEVSHKHLKAFEMDATHCPDLFPPLVALAVHCKGESRIKGVHRLIHKESNRAHSLKTEFGKLGVKIRIEGDDMIIPGGQIRGGRSNSCNDHRIAMALAVAALAAPYPIEIINHECIAKSYPIFFEDLKRLGAGVAQRYFDRWEAC